MALSGMVQEEERIRGYDHESLEPRRRVLRFLLRVIGFPLFAKIDHVEGLDNIPPEGPAILMMNHIAFVDSLVMVHVTPRNIVPLAKVEVYDYPFIGIIPGLWGVIPVHRDTVDRNAIQKSLEVLRAGEILLVAPEGTRNHGLQKGLEGVAYFSSRSGAPVVPVAIEGTVGFPALRFTPRWRQPGIRIRYGKPFRYRTEFRRSRLNTLRKMTNEAMYVLAGMLPENRRGVYADLTKATQETIEWV
jgi:1-acyl-sn-glycerol-3-phosphate acyltransferase